MYATATRKSFSIVKPANGILCKVPARVIGLLSEQQWQQPLPKWQSLNSFHYCFTPNTHYISSHDKDIISSNVSFRIWKGYLWFWERDWVESRRFFHQLHHRYFECNYGEPEIPFDQWFGTYHDGTTASVRKIRERMRKTDIIRS